MTTEPHRIRTPSIKNPILWVVAAAFAPYLVQGIGLRLEHVAIYGFGAWGTVALLASPAKVRPRGLFVAAFFVAIGVWIGVVTVLGGAVDRAGLDVLAAVDHFLRPAALAVGVAAWTLRKGISDIASTLRSAATVMVVFLGANTLLGLLAGTIDIGPIVEPFRSGRVGDALSGSRDAVFIDFGGQGRITGIFGLPFDAGVAYSVGIFGWIYVAKTRRQLVSIRWYIAFGLLMLGGLLTVSKAFLLGGFPLFLFYWLSGRARIRFITSRFVVVASLMFLMGNLLLANWVGFQGISDSLEQTVGGESSVVETLTAGRFGSAESSVGSQLVALAGTEALFFGVGFGSTTITFDNAYLAFFAQGGIVALTAYVTFLAVLASMAWRSRRSAPEESRLLLILVIFIAGAGMGAPVVSVVRASTLLWLLVLLATAAIHTPTAQRAESLGRAHSR